MAKKLFVGNLPYTMTSDQLRELFAAIGTVTDANVVIDKMNQRSRGFGFVEFEKDEDALKAITALDGSDQDGRKMVVKEALPRPEKTV